MSQTFSAFVAGLGGAAAGCLLLAELLPRLGSAPARITGYRPAGGADGWGVRFLLGVQLAGAIFLGLAACGISRPLPLAGSLALAVAFGSTGGNRMSSPLLSALRAVPRPGLSLAPFMVLAAIPIVLGLVIPSLEQDSYEYHLAFGWRCLELGRVAGGYVPYVFHLPLPVDLAGSLGLLAGEERVGQWIAAGSWLAVGLVFMGRLAAEERPLAGYAGLLLPLAAGAFTYLMASGKNDIPSSACLVAGGLLWGRRGSVTGALLLGCAVAGKFVYGPIVAVWALVNLPRMGILAPSFAAICLPVLSWWTKTFLFTGNPVYPFGWRYIPSLGWGAMNDAAMTAHARGFFHPDALELKSLPKGWFRHFLASEPHQLAVVPLLLALSFTRRRVVALVGGQLATMAIGHMTRYLLPAGWLLDLLAVREALRLKGRGRTAVLWLAVAVGTGYTLWNSRPLLARWPDLGRTTAGNRAFRLSTFDEALRAFPNARGRATLCVGEIRTYPLHGRVAFDGMVGETPLMWKFATESRDEREMAKRARQAGIGRIFYNFMGAFWACDRYEGLPWGQREMGIYRRFMAGNLAESRLLSRVDENSGGFYLFVLGRPPGKRTAGTDAWLPGSDAIFAKAARLERARDFRGSAVAYWEVAAAFPWYGHALNMGGHGLGLLKDYARSMQLLERGIRAGVVDMANIPEYGVALLETGRPLEANEYLARALPIYVNQYDPIRLNLAWTWVQKAMGELLKKRTREADAMLDTAEALLEPSLVVTYLQYTATRKFFRAQVRTLKAEAALKRGEREAARDLLKSALEVDPGGRMDRDIRVKLDALSVPSGDGGWYEVAPAKGSKL